MGLTYEDARTRAEGHGLYAEGIRPHIMGLGSGLNSLRILLVWYGTQAKWVDLETNEITQVGTVEELDAHIENVKGLV